MYFNIRLVMRLLSFVSAGIGVFFLPSLGWALWYGEFWTLPGLLLACGITFALAGVLYAFGRGASQSLNQRGALLLVAGSWILSCALGALPFICTGALNPVSAFFESVSGFTTTGATVFDVVEDCPKGVLFWRSFTHWLGGMGIVLLFIAVMPYIGAGGKLLLKTESSGPDPRALRPRFRDNAVILMKVYIALTLLQTLLYMLTGKMNLFDSLCHTFGALATGGFSTRTASIAYYDSLPVEIITIAFMVAGATSFGLYVGLMVGNWRDFIRNTEWRAMMFILIASSLLIATNTAGWWGYAPIVTADGLPTPPATTQSPPGILHSLRAASFAVSSLMTNTGFVTDDFDQWPYFSRMLLIAVMFVGGSAGSTAGGIKVIRIVMMLKIVVHRIQRMFRPYTLQALRVDGEVVSESIQNNVMIFIVTYLLCFAVNSLVMSAFGLPFDSAASAVAACMNNTGPGLELVGAPESFSCVPLGGQCYLSFCMILGRLELFTILVLFVPSFWRSR